MGRVTVAGIARRLAVDISLVEELRLTADAAIQALLGQGRVTVTTQWCPLDVVVRLENPEATLDDDSELTDIVEVDDPQVETIFEPPGRIFLRLNVVPEMGDEGEEE